MQGLFVAVKKSASPRGGPAPHIHPLTAAGSLLRERWPSPEMSRRTPSWLLLVAETMNLRHVSCPVKKEKREEAKLLFHYCVCDECVRAERRHHRDVDEFSSSCLYRRHDLQHRAWLELTGSSSDMLDTFGGRRFVVRTNRSLSLSHYN